MTTATPAPGKLLLSPSDHTLILIDFQSQMAFATRSIDLVELRSHFVIPPKSSRHFVFLAMEIDGEPHHLGLQRLQEIRA